MYMLVAAWAFARSAHRVQGLIVDSDNASFTVEYRVNGQTLQLTESLPSTKGMSGLTRMQLRPGNSVPILYDPALPSRARWDSNRAWGLPVAIMALATIAFGAAMFPDFMARPLR